MGDQRRGDLHERQAGGAPDTTAVPAVPTAEAAGGVGALQRSAGNRAARELLRAGQARLEVGAADDAFEREADTVARQVVAALAAPGVARRLDDQPPLARKVMRRAIGAEGGALDPGTEAAITSARGGGAPLGAGVRRSMEDAFGGVDFSGVRLHSGPGAAALNQAVSAEAFTIGSDIFFSAGAPDAASPAGQELLAHELTHTVQQGASPAVQRLWNPFKKKQAAPPLPSITPQQAQELINQVANSPQMQRAEAMRAEGKEDAALDAVESYWDTGKVSVGGTDVELKDFKPLLFTPAERRMVKVKKWRLASAVKSMFDESVRKGETAIPVKQGAPSASTKEALKEHQKAKGGTDGGGVAKALGGVGQASGAGGLGSHIGQHFEDSSPQGSKGMSLWSKETDTSYNQKGDGLYAEPSMQSKSDWANGILGVITDTFSFLSQVVVVIKQIQDDKSSKADVAESTSGALATLTTTAEDIMKVVQEAQGSEITTNVFHWVPGLSIFSNAFMALKSAISLVPKAVGLHGIRTHGAKVTDKEREDLKMAIERLWVRSSQQVEADAFATAKSLTNAGLAIAEVASAGGFGIPRLASAVVSGAGVVHSLGHAIADSLRAAATKASRVRYFGAHESGSAEQLIRTDPQAAAEAIMTRAMEGDAQAIGVLKGFGIKLPVVGADQAPGTSLNYKPRVPSRPAGRFGPADKGNKGRAAIANEEFDYDHASTGSFDEAMVKLLGALAESKEPKTISDKLKDTWKTLKETPGAIRDRYRDAKRIADARNEMGHNKKTDRGGGWAVTKALFGSDSDIVKLAEKTKFEINTSQLDAPSKQRLNASLRPEALLQAEKAQLAEDAARKPISISGPLDMRAFQEAEGLPAGRLSNIVHGGKAASGLSDLQWNSYLAVFARKLNPAV